MSIKVGADLSPIAKFTGSVLGFIHAYDDPAVKNVIADRYVSRLKQGFMTHAIAAKDSPNMKHMFEWKEEFVYSGEMSTIPLFHIKVQGRGKAAKMISFDFLPSTRVVPKPNPDDTAIDPEIIAKLSDHVFRLKAVVMETQSSVEISPKNGGRLFVPWMMAKNGQGYVMTTKETEINPGGEHATGGFTQFWNNWWSTVSHDITREVTEFQETKFENNGRKYVQTRSSRTGRFGRKPEDVFKNLVAIANAEERTVKAAVKAEELADKHYEENGDWA